MVFPSVILIKTTLGLLALTLLAFFAMATRKLALGRELAFVLAPAGVYLLTAIAFGMNIGSRHLLPFYGYLFIFAGAGAAALAASGRRWLLACAVLVAAHVISSLAVFPHFMAYANEAWGGPANAHNLLSDASVEWGEQLFQVKAWQDRHPGEECWFAYFVYPEINPETYGIRCHHLPTSDTGWLGGAENIPPVIDGTVLLSASDLAATEEPNAALNPYRAFQKMKPDETIDYGVMIFRGRFDMREAAATARVQNASQALRNGDDEAALQLAHEAVAIDSALPSSDTVLGDVLARMGRKDEAHEAWEDALAQAQKLEPDAQAEFIPRLEARVKR